jgi:hypothetical protein
MRSPVNVEVIAESMLRRAVWRLELHQYPRDVYGVGLVADTERSFCICGAFVMQLWYFFLFLLMMGLVVYVCWVALWPEK